MSLYKGWNLPLNLVVAGLKRLNCKGLFGFRYPQKYLKQFVQEGARSDGISYANSEVENVTELSIKLVINIKVYMDAITRQ